MRRVIRLLSMSLISAVLGVQAHAAMVFSASVTIREFFVLSEYGGGDVGFVASSPTNGCAHGFKNLYAAVMMAYATKAPIRVAAMDDSIYPGSSGTYCRVYSINFDPN